MALGDILHWYIGPGCNVKPPCAYCFAQDFDPEFDVPLSQVPEVNSPENLKRLARRIAQLKIPKDILGGGEPLLAEPLEEIIRILKDSGAYVGVHTNGILFYRNQRKVDEIANLADEIAIPIDSLDPEIQGRLRPYDPILIFEDVFPRLLSSRTKVGIHTVATTANLDSIPAIYERIKDTNFKFWKIFEFNYGLAFQRLWEFPIRSIEEFRAMCDQNPQLREFAGLPGPADRAHFFRHPEFAKRVLDLEGRLKTKKDSRVEVVLTDDLKQPYFCVNNNGTIFVYHPGEFADSLHQRYTTMLPRTIYRDDYKQEIEHLEPVVSSKGLKSFREIVAA